MGRRERAGREIHNAKFFMGYKEAEWTDANKGGDSLHFTKINIIYI